MQISQLSRDAPRQIIIREINNCIDRKYPDVVWVTRDPQLILFYDQKLIKIVGEIVKIVWEPFKALKFPKLLVIVPER